MSGPVHLASRFLGSLSPRPVDPADERWVRTFLGPGELALWESMSRADRKHAAGVARRVDAAMTAPEPWILAAAALHDVGKVVAGLGTLRRTAATVVIAVAGRSRVGTWASGVPRGSVRRRIADYAHHDRLGAELLLAAGADPRTAAWARDHHRREADWTVPEPIGRALVLADDD